MRNIGDEELKNILENHKKWLSGVEGGVKANLSRAYLSGADLSGAELSEAYLSWADLSWANLSGADLSRADLPGADLSGVNLSRANLSGACLLWVNLSQANLLGANLSRAALSQANLLGANLLGANLLGANIDYSSLPLWCGSLGANFDDRQIKQIAYHMVKAGLNSKNTSEETKRDLIKMIDFANEFHRAEECGIITYEVEIAHDNKDT